mmetsp:Transcript_24801/g.69072  ORF Transcript_24801/g.69072 Transcript_24801/m.69072 type:complete len:213 (-) Transcript_24801:418-1056(-)
MGIHRGCTQEVAGCTPPAPAKAGCPAGAHHREPLPAGARQHLGLQGRPSAHLEGVLPLPARRLQADGPPQDGPHGACGRPCHCRTATLRQPARRLPDRLDLLPVGAGHARGARVHPHVFPLRGLRQPNPPQQKDCERGDRCPASVLLSRHAAVQADSPALCTAGGQHARQNLPFRGAQQHRQRQPRPAGGPGRAAARDLRGQGVFPVGGGHG